MKKHEMLNQFLEDGILKMKDLEKQLFDAELDKWTKFYADNPKAALIDSASYFLMSDDEIEKLAEELGLKVLQPNEQLSLFDPRPGYENNNVKVQSSGCEHNWETYIGLVEKFDHCSKCGVKK